MKVVLIVILALVTLYLLLPYVALYFANRALAKLDGYRGRIKKIRINLFKGVIIVRELQLNKYDESTHLKTPFLTAPQLKISVQLGALFHKLCMATIVITQPVLELIAEKDEQPESKKEKDKRKDEVLGPQASSLKTMLQGIMPFKIELEIKDGKIKYLDPTSTPRVDVAVTALNLLVSDFSNRNTSATLPARIKAIASVYEGRLDLNMTLWPLADQLTFDLNLELKDTNMVLLNDFFRAYARIDVNKGTFSMYTEIAAKNGSFKGYVKPVLKDLDLIGPEDRNDNLFRKLWEGFVAVVIQTLENNKSDQIATKIPIEGRFDDPHVNIFSAVAGILKNAFIRAIQPSLENSIGSMVGTAVSGTRRFVKNIFRTKER